MSGAVFKTACEIARVSLGGFDSHTPPPATLFWYDIHMAAKAHSNFMTEEEFKDYTKRITMRIVDLVELLPNNQKAQIIGNQLLQSSASIGANYRSACRAKSTSELVKHLSAVECDTDRTLYWLEIIVDSGLVAGTKLLDLTADLDEIVSMTASSIVTLREKANAEGKVVNF